MPRLKPEWTRSFLRKQRISGVASYLAALLLASCSTFAPPSPLATLGGPATTPEGQSELGMAVGGAGVLYQEAHSGGIGLFGRYRYGLTSSLDIGADTVFAKYEDHTAATAKLAMRYQLEPQWRLEWGLGAADASEGKSLNADLALTWGTRRDDRNWNYYTSLRLAGAKGYPGNAVFDTNKNDAAETAPPDSAIVMLNLGSQARVAENQRFVFEGGIGVLKPWNHDPAMVFFVSAALLFDVKDKP